MIHLKHHRPQGLPPVRVVDEMPESDEWAAVRIELPFEAANEVLGVQMDRSIVPGIWVNHTVPTNWDAAKQDLSDLSSD